MSATDTLREAVATEACVYDKTGRAIMRGDVVKVLHFTDERGHKRYMYKQCLGPGTYRSGKHQYVMFSHLNFIEDPSVRNGPYHEHPGAHLPHYEIVQSIDAKWRDRPRAAPRLYATVRQNKLSGNSGELADAYRDLAARQTDTEPDIAKVVRDNRSELYMPLDDATVRSGEEG